MYHQHPQHPPPFHALPINGHGNNPFIPLPAWGLDLYPAPIPALAPAPVPAPSPTPRRPLPPRHGFIHPAWHAVIPPQETMYHPSAHNPVTQLAWRPNGIINSPNQRSVLYRSTPSVTLLRPRASDGRQSQSIYASEVFLMPSQSSEGYDDAFPRLRSGQQAREPEVPEALDEQNKPVLDIYVRPAPALSLVWCSGTNAHVIGHRLHPAMAQRPPSSCGDIDLTSRTPLPARQLRTSVSLHLWA